MDSGALDALASGHGLESELYRRGMVRLGRAPLLAGFAISLSDPGGPLESVKESGAALKTVLEAAREASFGRFVQSVAQDAAARAQRRETALAAFTPARSRARE